VTVRGVGRGLALADLVVLDGHAVATGAGH
jgi:hypothetical protein